MLIYWHSNKIMSNVRTPLFVYIIHFVFISCYNILSKRINYIKLLFLWRIVSFMINNNYWLKIATYDLKTAEAMLKSKRYLYVGFMCNQSIEKILKGIYSDKFNQLPPRIHNLARLLKLVELGNDIPKDLLEVLNDLNPLNIAARYPDQQLDIIKELDFDYSSKLLENTRRLFRWLKTKR